MSQADESHTPSAPASETEARSKASATNSPPPCGEGLGVGVSAPPSHQHGVDTPTRRCAPTSPQGGGEPACASGTDTRECPTLTAIGDIVFDMEDLLAQGLCLTEAMISFVEGRRDTLRVKPNTIYFFAFEVQGRFERLQEEWRRLFALTHPQPGEAALP